jgi:replicative DNA helicase
MNNNDPTDGQHRQIKRTRFENVIAVDLAGRVPPHNPDAESALLSAVLTSSKCIDLLDRTTPEDFYGGSNAANGRIFQACLALRAVGQPIDIQTVAGHLRSRDELQAVGGIGHLARLLDAHVVVENAGQYASIIRELSQVRRLAETCQRIAAECYARIDNVGDFIDEAEQRVYKIAHESRQSPGMAQIYDVQIEALGAIERAATVSQAGESGCVGLSTGYKGLDAQTSGMHPGELTILAARPGVGKTALAVNIAVNVAKSKPAGVSQCVLFFSLEMPNVQLVTRMICDAAGVSVAKARKGEFETYGQWDAMITAGNEIGQLPIFLRDATGLTIQELRRQVRITEAGFASPSAKIALVVTDYLQLMRGPANSWSRENEIAEISRGLKALAKDMKVPVLALAQLNRGIEARKSGRPMLSDLRESGQIEMDADVVQFIYRPEMALEKGSSEAEKVKGYAEVIVAKQRNGPTGSVPMRFVGEFTRFEDFQEGSWRPDAD